MPNFSCVIMFSFVPLQFEFCNQTALDEEYYKKYSAVRMTNACPTSSKTSCPYWIPPKTFTALAIPKEATVLEMWMCSLSIDGNITHTLCDEETSKEYRGHLDLWPSSIDVQAGNAPSCFFDQDCPGSYCDTTISPARCAPRDTTTNLLLLNS